MHRAIAVFVTMVLTGALFGLCALTVIMLGLITHWFIAYLHTVHPALGYGVTVGTIIGCLFGAAIGLRMALKD